MSSLYLVRHGQASFGAADYDQLSDLGFKQCTRLGEYFRERGFVFDAALRGSLRRHVQSLDAIVQGLGTPLPHTEWPGLNEYDSHAVLATVHPEPLAAPSTPEAYRHHFRLLRHGLAAWMNGSTSPQGMPSYRDFLAGIVQALDHVRSAHQGHVLMVSSGGPIATAIAHVLGAPAEAMIELNMRMRNSAVTEFAFTPKRHMLQGYNHLPHLDGPAWADWVTYT